MEPLDFLIDTSSFFVNFQKNNCTISFGLEKKFQKYPQKLVCNTKPKLVLSFLILKFSAFLLSEIGFYKRNTGH